jgi:prepilin-type N-terminal cleavage/methylation domain-containing protein
MAGIKKLLKGQKGMSLIEVAMALTLFSVFILAFMNSFYGALRDSENMRSELMLKHLAQFKINELIVDPPDFKESLTSASKKREDFKDFPGYYWEYEIKKIHIPDLSKIQGKKPGEQSNNSQEQLEKRIFKQIKDNMEKMIWQVGLTVVHKESEESYELSTWFYNDEVPVKIQGI